MNPLRHFREIWLVDFEYGQSPELLPAVRCMCAREYRTGQLLRLWADELETRDQPPIGIGPESLLVAYFASAELGSFLSLGWSMPARILDLFTEFRCLTNGRRKPAGNGLLGALAYFGLSSIEASEKAELRELALRGGHYSADERAALLDYCQSDVDSLARLLHSMEPHLDLPRALLRGRYMAAIASMEQTGIPVDVETLNALRANWPEIQTELIGRVDSRYGVYDGRTFKTERFARWLVQNDIPWLRTDNGNLSLSSDSFRQMARSHPEVTELRELRHALGELRLESLAVGADGRNRCLLSPFASKTSRNQPSNSKFVFGPSCWLRGLIKPEPGRAVAYVDWSQQEHGIAGALSGDAALQLAYQSADPYLEFAKQAGAVPTDATKETHPAERDQFKACTLAVQYGMGEQSLAQRIGQPTAMGRELLQLHKSTYPTFWAWSNSAVNHAMLLGWLQTVFGWRIHTETETNPRSLSNFPMQANGAEMLRLACCLATERGIAVCCPVHDALLVEGPAREIRQVVAETQTAMAEASRVVLGGFELRIDAEIVSWPNRYMDKRGRAMWQTVTGILAELHGARRPMPWGEPPHVPVPMPPHPSSLISLME